MIFSGDFNPFIHGRGQLHKYIYQDIFYGYPLSFDGHLKYWVYHFCQKKLKIFSNKRKVQNT